MECGWWLVSAHLALGLSLGLDEAVNMWTSMLGLSPECFNLFALISKCTSGVQPHPSPDFNLGQVRLLIAATNHTHSTPTK